MLGERQDELNRLRAEHDDLLAQFSTETAPAKPAAAAVPLESSDLLIDLGPRSGNSFDESAAREALMGSRLSPGSLRKSSKTVRFRDSLVDTEEMENPQALQLHQRVIDEQDESLDRLSASIRTQRELSIQIGDELDDHVRLLDDVDELVDRHQTRLTRARRRLDRFAETAKENGNPQLRQYMGSGGG